MSSDGLKMCMQHHIVAPAWHQLKHGAMHTLLHALDCLHLFSQAPIQGSSL